MDIQKEVRISTKQPVVFCAGTEMGELYMEMVRYWELDRSGYGPFAASLFYQMGRSHGIREERARRKRKAGNAV